MTKVRIPRLGSDMQESAEVLEANLAKIDPDFVDVVRSLPDLGVDHLPSHWLPLEVIERFKVLACAGLEKGMNVLEVGAGAHAISTVPIAHLVGETGRVVAVERERWRFFDEVLRSTGLRERVLPLACDATQLPLSSESFDLTLLVHGVRSLHDGRTILAVFREMLRVAPLLFVADSLPIARTDGQRAHLAMYNLREEIFEAVLGRKDDIRYLPLEKLVSLAQEAGGNVVESGELEVEQPHFLAFIPREYVERIGEETTRRDLLRRWERANEMLRKFGEEHPPVGFLLVARRPR